MMIKDLWSSKNEQDWQKALSKYYNAVKSDHIEIEKEMENLDWKVVAQMSADEFYDFLLNKYFFWKYTQPNRYATTTMSLKKYKSEGKMSELKTIHKNIFAQNPDDITACLKIVSSIKGLGMAGASGLLSLLYPTKFGTVDQFAIYALLKINNLSQKDVIGAMNPSSISLKNAEFLINIYKQKAKELNSSFNTTYWTPRKIDQILWSIDRKN